jgi:CRP-like cAMP-binding protein
MAPKSGLPAFRNQLLAALAATDIALLQPHLERVDLELRAELEHPHRPIKHVYFLESGMASIVGRGPKQKEAEVGVIGREGCSGLMVVLGNDRSPHATYMQMAGSGHRIATDDLRNVMKASAILHGVLLKYVQAFMIQATYTAIANGTANLEERLARWLLMAHDRMDGDELPLIHEFLALMLAVRRPGVTVAIRSLEEQAVIKAKRGIISVLDRKGLEKIANSSYGAPEAEYKRRMG